MSFWGKCALLSSGFSLIIMGAARLILGGWHPLFYGFLAVFLAGLLLSLALDYKFYSRFLSIKTAKKGLSLGWSLLLLIVFLSAAAYLSRRFDRSFDVTKEGLNSLSEQSLSALKRIDSELTFYVFYKGKQISPTAENFKMKLSEDLRLYKLNSSKIKVLFIDAYKNNLKAQEYLSKLHDKNQKEVFVFVSYKDRKIRADFPWTEESLTSAVIKAQQRESKNILFLTGHGERALNNEEPSGMNILSRALTESGFSVSAGSILKAPPSSPPALVVIAGPVSPFPPAEKTWLKNYLKEGGRLFISLDPKEDSGLEDFLKTYGLIFKNNFILNQISAFGLAGEITTLAAGVIFDKQNPITRKIEQPALFEKASALDVMPSAFEKFKISYLVRSHDKSFTSKALTNKINIKNIDQKPRTIALELAPKVKEGEKKPNFRLALFGDSDFLTNRFISIGSNKDLALNAIVSLAGEAQLAGLRPRLPAASKITLNRPQQMSLVILYIAAPLLFLITGLWLWIRRRSA